MLAAPKRPGEPARICSPDLLRNCGLAVRFSEMICERCPNKAVNNEF